MLSQALAGGALALLIAAVARRARSLSRSGAVAAFVVGTIAITAGWSWGALLIAYFASSTLLSKWRAAEKAQRTDAVVEKGGERDAWQVLANGGAFTVAALGAIAAPEAMPWGAAGAGALAAAAADTWATEVGTLARGAPRSVLTWQPAAVGTSGAISLPGTLALLAGAFAVALLAHALHLAAWVPVGTAGIVGAFSDTLLGAVLQERRWCARCDRATERRVHDCGAPTQHTGGLSMIDNDVVNALCTVIGAGVALALA